MPLVRVLNGGSSQSADMYSLPSSDLVKEIDYTDFFAIMIGINSSSASEYGSSVQNTTQGVTQTRLQELKNVITVGSLKSIVSISECHGNSGDTYRFHVGSNSGYNGLVFIIPVKKLITSWGEWDM